MPIYDPLRDNIWQFYGAIIGVAGIIVTTVVAILLFWRQLKRKELSYAILAEIVVVETKEGFGKLVKVLFDGQPVSSVHLVAIRLKNSGNTDILEVDFRTPLIVQFPGSGDILSAKIGKASPPSLRPTPDIDEQRKQIKITPLLINDKESFALNCLVSQYDGTINISGRIVGISEIKETAPPYTSGQRARNTLAIVAAVIVFLYLKWQSPFVLFLLLVTMGLFLAAPKLWRDPDTLD